jgi:hypothetical protein
MWYLNKSFLVILHSWQCTYSDSLELIWKYLMEEAGADPNALMMGETMHFYGRFSRLELIGNVVIQYPILTMKTSVMVQILR